MTRYAVIKIFDTLKEADAVAELITEDDIVMVLPLEQESVEGTPPPTAAADSSSSGPRTAPGSGRLSPAESERPALHLVRKGYVNDETGGYFFGYSVKV
jgi:hypothetical protein